MRAPVPLRWRQRLLLALLAPAGLVLLTPAGRVQAAPFSARVTEADPPTGETPSARDASAEEPLTSGSGIRWRLAPWRKDASVSLDLRWLRTEVGRRSLSGLVVGEIDFASYIWQPWFVQLRAGLGLLADRERSTGDDTAAQTSSGRGLTLRGSASIFPASRFPLELRFDRGDTRSGGELLVNDYRTLRIGISQGWRPATGNDQWQFNVDHSRIDGSQGVSDRLSALRATGVLLRGRHAYELGASWSSNTRNDSDDRNTQALLSARHSWQAAQGLTVESLASWNDLRVRVGGLGQGFGFDTRLLQLSTLGSWRPAPGSVLYDAQAPLVVTATLRAVDTSQDSAGGRSHARSFSLAAGASKDFSREWRASLGLGLNRLDTGGDGGADLGTVNATLSYSPAARSFGAWRWSPSASGTAALADSPEGGRRRTAGLQGSHGVSRVWEPGSGQTLSINVSQSLGWLTEAPGGQASRGIGHAVGLYWQGGGESAQNLVGFTLSDSRTQSDADGRYQFANLQVSRRDQLTRYSSWSANLTLQATRSDAELLDPFTGDRRRTSDGWQRYASGTLSYESQRVWGVPRLRFTTVLNLNTQQTERRANGDLDAPIERVTESLEARLDWTAGRLDTRLSARVARVDGRTVAAVSARALRRF